MQELVIHRNIERNLQCIFMDILGMKERKENNKIYFKSDDNNLFSQQKLSKILTYYFYKLKIRNFLNCLFQIIFTLQKIIYQTKHNKLFPSFHFKSPGKLKHIIHRRKINQMRYPL
jgi:hypothetical protein